MAGFFYSIAQTWTAAKTFSCLATLSVTFCFSESKPSFKLEVIIPSTSGMVPSAASALRNFVAEKQGAYCHWVVFFTMAAAYCEISAIWRSFFYRQCNNLTSIKCKEILKFYECRVSEKSFKWKQYKLSNAFFSALCSTRSYHSGKRNKRDMTVNSSWGNHTT